MAEQKIVLITGATGRIGAATARTLAGQGHHVVLGARRIDRLVLLAARIRAAGGSAECHIVDVTDADDAQTFVLAAFHRHGRIDVLVNAAGVHAPSRLDALKLLEWDRMLEVNVRGALYAIAAVLPLMQRAGGGHVVNLAPPASSAGTGPAQALPGATAGALRAISEALRQEAGDIHVSLVAPDLDGGARAVADAIGAAVERAEELDACPA
ncbi:SDR family oxidoreductase [Pseudoduganella lutea]|uniref:SDR family NAD(P)-dependent oxidoreductase n=1 Tax=Pseudoduganella lutea TaxID=321985 RepID=A0A4P6L7K8_9BURK|nr:SDR family NAD(P)-dependent oxidoreductase [Pseudoduganella lutea]QBE66922.1 SDR family NAD(P)-dependent oxidoreductase [Pseudoduganella lutea]